MRNLIVFTFLCLTVLASSCHRKSKDKIYSDEIAKIVSQVTNGKITSEDKIEVRFVNIMVAKDAVGTEIKDKLFDFSPSIDGKTYWKDNQTLVFEPEKPLPFRKSYDGKLDLLKISQEYKKTPVLKFSFTVAGREISTFEGELFLKDMNSPILLNYRGKISFTEKTKLEDVSDAVTLKSGFSKYDLIWNAETDGKTFVFQSSDITRDNSTHEFKITVDKGKLDLSEEYVKEFQLTPITEMNVVEITKDEEGRSPKVRIKFSDEFDPEQDLNGLISTEPKSEIKLQKLGNILIVDAGFKFGSEYTVYVEPGLRSRWGTKTKERFNGKIKFSDIKPQIEFASDGVILPSGNNFKLQFYSANLKRVHIEVKKVYDNSLAEFLRTEQVNSLKNRKTSFEGSYINRVGVIVHNETFEIGDNKNEWLLNEIDLSKVVEANQKALLLIRLNFNIRDMLVDIDSDNDNYIEEFGQIYKPLFFSDIALTCKVTGSNYIVYATDINTCKPLSGVSVQLRYMYNDNDVYENASTNGDGIAELPKRDEYNFYIQAEKDGERSIIKFNEMEWNISGFNIGGIYEDEDNTKAFIYTERGVYRPGDDINISAIVRTGGEKLPDNHPITLEMFNPQDKRVYDVTSKQNNDGFYNFHIQTKETDMTGNWRASFNVGNRQFDHTIKIETVVPYRLKVKIEPKTRILSWTNKTLEFNLISTYLFGNPAANLPAEVEMDITAVNKKFPKFENFTFTNPINDFKDVKKSIFEGTLDETGTKQITNLLPIFYGVPSALNVRLTAKVIEKGGRPNINWIDIPANPYSHYVGLQVPEYYYITTGRDAEIPLIVVDNDGNPVAGKNIKYRIYRNTEYWWWQYDEDRKLKFKSDNNTVQLKEGNIVSGTTHRNIQFLPIEKGCYFIEAVDESGTGHSAGIFVNAYPYGGDAGQDKNAGTLPLHADKEKYNVGETAKIKFPAPKEGTVLLTVERANEILSQKWYYPDKDDEMVIEIPVTSEMVPNVYVSISLLQPHSQTKNDRPIRMFGILPLMVEDAETRHDFNIITESEFKPNSPFEVKLQTTDYKQSQFTIAVVDEGLLDITQFPTPDPWKYFFQKVRLNVRTYDLFSQVIAANKGDVFKLFAIGGGSDYRESQLKPEKGKRRFKPVCLFKGPLMTDANGAAVVKFDMPEYVGSVRIMVIGARENSFARAEKAVPVKSDLMLLGTLPRVIGPGEKFTVPVSVFAMKDNIGNVNVEIKTEGPVIVQGNKVQTLNFTKATDKDCYFSLATKAEAGQSKITITAKSSSYSAVSVTDLMVRPTSPRIYSNTEGSVVPGQKSVINVPGMALSGTNTAKLTLSKFPAVNFAQRLDWLIHYPYGCIEQTTSSVFPQLFLKKFIQYPDAYSKEIDNNINEGIQRLRSFQLYSGAFSYWPYGDQPSDWGTLYAGHFLVEAKKLGYYIQEDLYRNWLNYTQQSANSNSGDLQYRVYRVYILALAGNAVLSEMNQLKESNLGDMNNVQKWMLAAAYQLAGLADKTGEIINDATTTTDNYSDFSGTYGSGLRDKAMILDALVVLKQFEKADKLTLEISKSVSASTWYSTQTIGYSLLALGKYMQELSKGNENVNIKGYVLMADGSKVPFNTDKSVSIDINNNFGKAVTVVPDQTSGAKKVYTSLAWSGVPLKSNIIDEEKNVSLKVEWFDNDGSPMDIAEIKQGTTFWGHFHVENISQLRSIEEMALVQIFPSGWEVENTRLLNESLPSWTSNMLLNHEEYLDIQDDRVMWFFDIYNSNPLYNKIDFIVKLNAVTVGEYDLPGTLVEAMYNGDFKATKAGKRVKVVQ